MLICCLSCCSCLPTYHESFSRRKHRSYSKTRHLQQGEFFFFFQFCVGMKNEELLRSVAASVLPHYYQLWDTRMRGHSTCSTLVRVGGRTMCMPRIPG